MQPPKHLTDPQQVVRMLQIIVAALVSGVLMFAAVALSLSERVAEMPMLGYVGLGFATIAILVWSIVPAQIVATQRNQRVARNEGAVAEAELYQSFMTSRIVGNAVLEGAAFFNVIVYMSEGQWWSLAIVGLLLLMMLMNFPTRDRLDAFVAEQQALIQLDRDFSPRG